MYYAFILHVKFLIFIKIVYDLGYYRLDYLLYKTYICLTAFINFYIVCMVVIRDGRGKHDALAFMINGRSSDVGTK